MPPLSPLRERVGVRALGITSTLIRRDSPSKDGRLSTPYGATISRKMQGKGSLRRHETSRQRLGDQFARLLDAVERDERAQARSAFLTQQHGVEHVEEIVGDARTLRRRILSIQILIARYRPRDVVERVLDFLGAGVRRQGGQF